jgi:hypothetical protein
VLVAFDQAPDAVAPAPFWDRAAQTITATTGELRWDYGRRLVEVRAPRSQGIIGFAGGSEIKLPFAEVTVKTPFVSLLFTSLDDLPLDESAHILITAMAREKQTGAVFSENWDRLEAIGGPPLLMEPVQATIRLAGRPPAQVRPLDVYGVPRPENLPLDAAGGFAIDGSHRAYYYEVRR